METNRASAWQSWQGRGEKHPFLTHDVSRIHSDGKTFQEPEEQDSGHHSFPAILERLSTWLDHSAGTRWHDQDSWLGVGLEPHTSSATGQLAGW